MKKYIVALCSAALLLLFAAACDDNTGTLGTSTTPSNDSITINTATYQATSRSILVDSVLGKSSIVYFGRYTDPETNSVFRSDFMTQFNCVEGGNVFPPADSIKGDSAVRFELRLFFSSFYGDRDNAMQLEVYELERTLQEGKAYYTNVDPNDYLAPDAKPIATKTWTARDYILDESELDDSEHYQNVNIPLPLEKGNAILRDYREHPEHFANATNFIENVCKGLYVKCSQGDGTVICIDQVCLNVSFNMARTDSTYTTQFSGSQEVLQVNSFDNKGLDPLVQDGTCSWLKTPAGIFTEVTLPVDEITKNEQDTINSARIAFTRYNSKHTSDQFGITAPTRLLLIKKSEMHSFFAQNNVYDGNTSFINEDADSNKDNYLLKYNQYVFSNIARLIINCRNDRDKWVNKWAIDHPNATEAEAHAAYAAENPDWNKAMLIPVTPAMDASGSIVALRHDLSIGSARLIGGCDPIDIKIITSSFK